MRTPPMQRSHRRSAFCTTGASLLALAATQADILVRPEFPFSDPVPAARHERNWYPETAYNDNRWLIAWSNASIVDGEPDGIRAALFDEQSGLVTRFALQIAEGFGFNRLEEVAVAKLGSGFLVAWSVIDTHDEEYSAAVQVARVDREGRVVGSPTTVSAPSTPARFPQLASAGDRCLVAWTDDLHGDGTIEMRGCVVPADGPLSGLTVRDLSPPGVDQDETAVAFSNGKFLAVWSGLASGGLSGIRGALINLDGEPGAPFVISATGNERDARVSRLQDDFLVVWFDFSRDFGTNGSFGELRATRVGVAGQLLDTPPLVVRPNPNNDSVLFTEIAGGADDALILWTETDENDGSSGLHARRVTPNGTMLTPTGYPITDPKQIFDAALALGSEKWLLAYSHSAEQPVNGQWPSQILVRLLSPDGAPQPETFVVSDTPNRTEAVSVGALPDGYVAVWQDDRNEASSGWDVYGRRFSADGIPLDPQPLLVAGGEGDQISPAVGTNDNRWAVVWTDRRPTVTPAGQYYAYRIGSKVMGSPLPAVAMLSSPEVSARAPAIAGGPGGFMAVWRQDDLTGVDDIFGTQLTTAGTSPYPGGFAVCTHPAPQSAPSIGSNGSSYLVVWRDLRPPRGGDHVYAKLFQQAAPPETSDGFAVEPLGAEQYAPEVAGNGDQYLIAWRQSVSTVTGAEETINAIRVNDTGAVVDPSSIVLASQQGNSVVREPTVAALGPGWIVGWHEGESVRACRVAKAATLASEVSFEVAGPANFDRDTLTAAAGPGNGVVFGVFRDDLNQIRGVVVFPDEQLPQPTIAINSSGPLGLDWPPSAHFPLDGGTVNVSSDAQSWTPLTNSGLTWTLEPNQGIRISTGNTQRLFLRLSAQWTSR